MGDLDQSILLGIFDHLKAHFPSYDWRTDYYGETDAIRLFDNADGYLMSITIGSECILITKMFDNVSRVAIDYRSPDFLERTIDQITTYMSTFTSNSMRVSIDKR